ncbi:MAG: hypothetical protein A2X59_04090 [Nitrospirae bacterium GWC2_42_7]|nr:MAG: hypothetical protein A2X59_04090 [Nitrospirae bacterium GWC2_42_7]
MIDTPKYQALLENIKNQYDKHITIKIVNDINQFCKQHGVNIGNHSPFSPAIALKPRTIVIASQIDKDSPIERIERCGFKNIVEQLRINDVDFLIHLLLHELAHLLNNWPQEHECDCDKWAFEEMRKLKQIVKYDLNDLEIYDTANSFLIRSKKWRKTK